MITDMYFEPEAGELAVAPIEAFVGQLPFTKRDAHNPSTFLVAPDEDTLEDAIAAREADPRRFPTNVMLIDIGANRIDLSYRIDPLEAGRTFVAWLREHYKVRVRDEDFNDVTANVDPGLDYLFSSQGRP